MSIKVKTVKGIWNDAHQWNCWNLSKDYPFPHNVSYFVMWASQGRCVIRIRLIINATSSPNPHIWIETLLRKRSWFFIGRKICSSICTSSKFLAFASSAGGLRTCFVAAFDSFEKYAVHFSNTAFGGTEPKEAPSQVLVENSGQWFKYKLKDLLIYFKS